MGVVVRTEGLEPSTPNRTLEQRQEPLRLFVRQQDDSLPCMPFHHARARAV